MKKMSGIKVVDPMFKVGDFVKLSAKADQWLDLTKDEMIVGRKYKVVDIFFGSLNEWVYFVEVDEELEVPYFEDCLELWSDSDEHAN